MRRPSPALVIACLALFLALGGSAYAVSRITGKQVKDGSLTGKDVRNRSLGVGELSDSARKSLRGGTGPAGAKGDTGPQGAAGPQGAQGAPGAAGRDTATMWVVVNENGSVRNQSGGISSITGGSGTYFVTFPRSVRDCAVVATPVGAKLVGLYPRGQSGSGPAAQVYYETFSQSGSLSPAETSVVVSC